MSQDRLIPDLIRAFTAAEPAAIRFPDAVRPWQHVLDCLHGYLRLLDALCTGDGVGAWNFGPSSGNFATVGDVAQRTASHWGGAAHLSLDSGDHPHEAAILTLDSERARRHLGWTDLLTLDQAIEWTVDWEKVVHSGAPALDTSLTQLRQYLSLQPASTSSTQ